MGGDRTSTPPRKPKGRVPSRPPGSPIRTLADKCTVRDVRGAREGVFFLIVVRDVRGAREGVFFFIAVRDVRGAREGIFIFIEARDVRGAREGIFIFIEVRDVRGAREGISRLHGNDRVGKRESEFFDSVVGR